MIQRPVAHRLPLLRNAYPDRRSAELYVDSRGLREANTLLFAPERNGLFAPDGAVRDLGHGKPSDRDLTTKSPLCYISVTQVPSPRPSGSAGPPAPPGALPSSSRSTSVPVLPHRDAASPPAPPPFSCSISTARSLRGQTLPPARGVPIAWHPCGVGSPATPVEGLSLAWAARSTCKKGRTA